MAEIRQPLFPEENLDRPDQFDAIDFETTTGQSLRASFELSQLDSTVSAIARIQSLKRAGENGAEKLQPDELNTRFADSGLTFDEPMNPLQAQIVIDRNEERVGLQRVIEAGPQGGFYDAARFGAMLLPHALDPIDAAAGILTGGILTAGLKAAKVGGTAVRAARAAKLTPEQAFKRTAVEGFIGNIAVEPLVVVANKREMQDYGIEDAFINSVGGALGFAGIRYGAGKFANFAKRLPNMHDRLQRSSIGRLFADKKIDADPQVKQTIKEMGSTKELNDGLGVRRYEFKPKEDGELGRSSLFLGNNRAATSLDQAEFKPITDDLGDGIYLSDNPNVANGVSASHVNDIPGSIIEVSLKDIKTLDLDSPVPPKLQKTFETLTGKKGVTTPREAIDLVKARIARGELGEEVIEALNKAVARGGFDGYRQKAARFLDTDHEPYNQVMLFNRDKITEVGSFKSDPSKLPKVDRTQLKKIQDDTQSIRSDFDFDQAEFDEFNTISQTKFESINRKSSETNLDETIDRIDSLESQELLDAPALKEIEAIKIEKDRSDLRNTILKAAGVCLGR